MRHCRTPASAVSLPQEDLSCSGRTTPDRTDRRKFGHRTVLEVGREPHPRSTRQLRFDWRDVSRALRTPSPKDVPDTTFLQR